MTRGRQIWCHWANPEPLRVKSDFRLFRLRQRNELAVAGNAVEPSGLPVGFRLLDPLGPRGHEVPPDMARPVHRIAPEQHEAGWLDRAHGDPVAGPEHEKLARPEAVARDLDQPRDRVEAALFVSWIERNARPCL